jgi:hypothetical protein
MPHNVAKGIRSPSPLPSTETNNCQQPPEKLRSFAIYPVAAFHGNFAQHASENYPWPKITPGRTSAAIRVTWISSAVS